MTLDELIVDAIDKSRAAAEAQDKVEKALDAITTTDKKDVAWKLWGWCRRVLEQ